MKHRTISLSPDILAEDTALTAALAEKNATWAVLRQFLMPDGENLLETAIVKFNLGALYEPVNKKSLFGYHSTDSQRYWYYIVRKL